MLDYQDFTGRMEAVKTIDVRARVSGFITEIFFKDGEKVKEGDALFQIDDRLYKADLKQADANLNVAYADRNLQEKNAERAKVLFSKSSIAREEYETTLAAFKRADAAVGAAQAARDKAKLYLDYTRVIWEINKLDKTPAELTSVPNPVVGRISRRYVDPSNLVMADNTILTTIVTEDPMYAYFDVDERTYLDLVDFHKRTGGKNSEPAGLGLPLLIRLANESDFEKDKVGYVDFVDNRVVATTGTVRMRGVFKNPIGSLKAGLFVRVRLPIGSAYESLMIPDEAIQSDQERKYVWVVNAKGETEYRSVRLGQSIKELRVIRPPEKGKEGKDGLTKDDQVVISGMQRVRNGIQVDADKQAPPPPPEMPLVRLLNLKITN